MRFFYDTEFIEDGRTIELVSIGVVAEDGSEYYAVSTEFDPDRAGDWVRANVLPHLPPPASKTWAGRHRISDELLDFSPRSTVMSRCGRGSAPTTTSPLSAVGIDAAAAAPDPALHARAQADVGDTRSAALPPSPADAHDALVDARHNLRKWEAMQAATALTRRVDASPGG